VGLGGGIVILKDERTLVLPACLQKLSRLSPSLVIWKLYVLLYQ
jgi:hypothetical protein